MTKITKRDAVLKATLEIIAEQGFHNAPTSQIAKRAEVGMGTIYRYFKSKEELIHAIYQESEEAAKKYISEGYDVSAGLKTRYLHLCRRLYEYLIGNPLEYRFHVQYRNSPYGTSERVALLESYEPETEPASFPLLAIFTEGIKGGEVKNLSLPLLSALTLSPIFRLAGYMLIGNVEIERDEIEKAFAACWDAIATG